MVNYGRIMALCGSLALCSVLAPGNPLPQVEKSEPQTEVVVISTVHNDTAYFKAETLVSILKKVNPDLLLLEFDSSFFDSSFSLLDKYQAVSLESRAATTLQGVSKVKVRPYDIEGRNKFYAEPDYFKREGELNRELHRLYGSNGLSAEAKLLFETLLSLSAIRDSCGAERPEVINSSACDTSLEKKQHYSFGGVNRIIELTPALKEFDAFGSLAADFWVRRNEEMTRNIVRYAKEFRGKKIVVLCGYEHRYYLRKKLKEQAAKEDFVVREYWNY
ncbi:MAG TPA: hypothetical protein VM864_00790 [Pyrinomonadaceae bacterium]|jgi:hypothetical protein|nr:hypothetical protein [Pyrinomonadaceae bacterium]